MAKTTFIDGLTLVTAVFMNKIFGHVHDGLDVDGSAPKVDFTNHITYGANGSLAVTANTITDHVIEHTSGTGATTRFESDVVNSGASTVSGTMTVGSQLYVDGTRIYPSLVAGARCRILISTGGVITLGNAVNVSSAAWAGNEIVISFITGLNGDPVCVTTLQTTFTGSDIYMPHILSSSFSNVRIKVTDFITSSGTATYIDAGSPPLQDIGINFVAF